MTTHPPEGESERLRVGDGQLRAAGGVVVRRLGENGIGRRLDEFETGRRLGESGIGRRI